MSAIQLNFSIENGSYFEYIFKCQDINGNNINLSNYGIYLRWQTNISNEIYSFNNCDNQKNYRLSGDINGNIILQIPAKTTQNYNFLAASYDLEIQAPNEIFDGSGFTYSRVYYGIVSIITKNVPTPVPLSICNMDLSCSNCCDPSILDTNSILYQGNSIDIYGFEDNSSTITISDDRVIQKIKVKINNLNHTYPTNLIFLLTSDIFPSSGILLSANNKILNYQSNFTFTFSDDADNISSLNNIKNFGVCKIIDKTNFVQIPQLSLVSELSSLTTGNSAQGDWTLTIIDTDTDMRSTEDYSGQIVGSVDGWELIVQYEEDEIGSESINIE
jgi:subtilisin-like proprotein convertase family protein